MDDGCRNRLVAALPVAARDRLLALGEPVRFAHSQPLAEAGRRTQQVVFPTHGTITLMALVDDHPGLAVGMVGREGVLGSHLVLGLRHDPLNALAQGAVGALRIGLQPFVAELAKSRPLRRLLALYVGALMAQRATAAGCLHFHAIVPRLARWLLMSRDQADADSFHVTQERLAHALGVRRVGVTVAAGDLQRRGWIRYHRGEMTVLDHAGLEAASCSCYRADLRAYAEVMRQAR